MAKDAEAKKREAEAKRKAVESFKERLKPLINKTPSHSAWSYQRTLDFKKAHEEAKKVLNADRVTPECIGDVLRSLERFHA